jgi:hypothetical protein
VFFLAILCWIGWIAFDHYQNQTEIGIESHLRNLRKGPQDSKTEAEIGVLENKLDRLHFEASMKHCADLRAKKVADLTVNNVDELKTVCGASVPLRAP